MTNVYSTEKSSFSYNNSSIPHLTSFSELQLSKWVSWLLALLGTYLLGKYSYRSIVATAHDSNEIDTNRLREVAKKKQICGFADITP